MIRLLLERRLVPDAVLRWEIRRRIAARERRVLEGGPEAARARTEAFLAAKREGPVALHTEAANQQHYEVPAAFFREVLGPRMKYSSGFWHPGARDLAASETAMLDLSLERARVEDGMRVLDLGCGWGALSFRLLERFPRCEVVAVSNSHGQRGHVEAERDRRGLARLEVLTRDVNAFDPPGAFDRVLSVEMFEHLWNHERLMARLAAALRPEGLLFVHVFAHREHAYPFLDEGKADWMARTFFTGGWMPSHAALAQARAGLAPQAAWWVDGTHYARTSRAWLDRLDERRSAVMGLLEETYGTGEGALWHANWRLFFLACEELFGWRGGGSWGVSHHLFRVA